MTTLANQLREIAGQDTTPPLWIYVTKDQVPVLIEAAANLDAAENAFVRGVLFGAFSMQGRHEEASKLVQNLGCGKVISEDSNLLRHEHQRGG